ncbi:MAG: hypothetical protein Q8L26_08270 [Candidatus Omnitrophota bacterium]|nr:hypothetical protein [Candidatus Omnitrophota bacterium]
MDKQGKYKVVTFLNREELDFVDSVAKDLYFGHGIKIPRAKLIEEIIQAFRYKETKDRQALEQELIKLFKQDSQNKPEA